MKVVSLNVNGLRITKKRREVFNYLKNFESDIILLQETHSTPNDEKMWSKEWGRKIFFNHGSSASKGVAVLLNKNNPLEVETMRFDLEGRYMIMDLKLSNFKFILANVYGPNEDDPIFYVKFFEQIEARQNNSMILAGDFNTSMDPERDLFNHKGSNHSKKRMVIQQLLQDNNLVDVWRIKNPEGRVFSWRKPNINDVIMSRIDHFFISQDFVTRTKSVEIKPKYQSDHSRIELKLDFTDFKRGRGYWKFNNKHLKSQDFVSLRNNTILGFLYRVKLEKDSGWIDQWVNLKILLTNVIKDFTNRKAKERNQFLRRWNREF